MSNVVALPQPKDLDITVMTNLVQLLNQMRFGYGIEARTIRLMVNDILSLQEDNPPPEGVAA